MIQNLLSNWRTTSLGLSGIMGAVVNLVFAIRHGVDDQGTWMLTITQILTGIGVMASRDQAASRVDKEDTKSKIADLQQQVTEVKGDTATITKQ